MDIVKLERLGFKNLKKDFDKIKYRNKLVVDYKYYGRDIRPKNSITLSKIKISEVKKYKFLGLCCNKQGDKGFLFLDIEKDVSEKIKMF